jgi:hypothetical protein
MLCPVNETCAQFLQFCSWTPKGNVVAEYMHMILGVPGCLEVCVSAGLRCAALCYAMPCHVDLCRAV